KNGNLHEIVEKCKINLKEAQSNVDKNPHCHDIKKKETVALAEYNKAINDEEEFLYQKAKVEWISKGDRNNQYFHKVLKSKKQANRICSICDNNGNRLEGVQMEEQFVNHFKRFLAESDKVNKDKDFKGVFGIRLTASPDGYTFTFFKNAWEVVGNDVCLAIKEFFRIEKLLGEVNATLISLIPKITTPNKVSDYRPIACCNVVYKCISKIITERIKPGLHKLVDLNQSDFIQGRVIQDNILIAQELLKGYDRKNGINRCCFKIDIAKAYDTVDWCFLVLMVNGWVFFASGRGLRHEDPMSPCLFTLVMEIFTLLMKKNVRQNPKFKYHKGCKDIQLTNLCFADDLLVVCHGDDDSVRIVKETMMEFSEILRLVPNIDKSTVFFGSVKEEDKRKILDILPFAVGKLPMKYLGVPLITKKLGYTDCKQLIDKVKVLASLNVYWAGVFLIPKAVVKDIDKVLKGFLWCKGEIKRGKFKNIAEGKDTLWVKWVNVVKLKGKNLWEIQEEYNDSWMWKTLLDLRGKARKHIFKVLGDGKDTNFWHDQWSTKGVISDIERKYPVLTKVKVLILNNQLKDKTRWKDVNGNLMDFSSKTAWEVFNSQNAIVKWHKVVWFSQCNPRMAFIMWMAIKRRLQTQDRVMVWNNDKSMKCSLYKIINDSHNHLFFECDYSKEIWMYFKKKMGNSGFSDRWDDLEEQYANKECNNSIGSILRRITLALTVYHIWKERNTRIFKNEVVDVKILLKIIADDIKLQLMGLKVKNSVNVQKVAKD
ncbi:RNA-directed DNA polymerase, eukaryota, reverse transcriptase zinc-binding domain protein, partial [Tanacetum coccineum]